MRSLLQTLAMLCALATGGAAFAQGSPAGSYPSRPVRIVVPFSTGTAADIVARQLSSALAQTWGQGVIVENVAGAGGNIGAGVVAKAKPDGYTLLMLGINHVINPSLYKQVPYDIARDFRPIVRVALAPLAIVANPSFPANSITELVELAKSRNEPLLYGSGGNGSITHLSIELLKSRTGIRMTHVPYKSVAPMLTDILGNQVPIGSPAAASVSSFARAGTIKVLAITSAKRSSAFPDVPTVAEAGIAGFDVSAWNGLLAPAGTPDGIIAKIHRDVTEVAQSEAFINALKPQAMEVDLLGPQAYERFLAAELEKWSELVRTSGARLD